MDRKEQSLCEHDSLHTERRMDITRVWGYTALRWRTQEGPFSPGRASEGTIRTHTLQWGD